MNKEKLLEYYNNEIHTYKEQIEELEKKLSVLVEVISNSQSMIESGMATLFRTIFW